MSITFDVVMCNYNGEQFIAKAIESVLHQTYKNWKLILVDDCSTDNSKNIIKFYCENYTRIHALFHDNNYGYGASLRDGIGYGESDLVAIIDGDDWAYPNALQVMIEAHEQYPDASLIYSNYEKCDAKLVVKKLGISNNIPDGVSLLDCWVIPNKQRLSHLKTFKRKFYKMTEGVDPTLRKAVDKDLALKLEEVGKLQFLPIILYKHRRHPNAISTIYNDRRELNIKNKQRIIYNTLKRRGLYNKENKKRYRCFR